MRKLLSNASDFIYSFDVEGKLIYANKPFLDLLHLSPDEIQGKTFQELGLPPEFSEKHDINIRKVISSGNAVRDRQLFLIGSDIFYFEYLFAPVRDEAGLIKGVIATPRDITNSYFWNFHLTEERFEVERKVYEVIKLKDLIGRLIFRILQDMKAPVINLESLVSLLEEDLNEENRQKIALILEMIRQSIYRVKISSSTIASVIGTVDE